MFFREVLNEDLGCGSYVIADAGEAVVVDPKWEIEDYLLIAIDNGYRITRILETHNHADHLSGRGRLVNATGAKVFISSQADVEYEHEPLEDGSVIDFGSVRIVALATPGHRPEHLSFLVEDRSRGSDPWLLLSGDSLFVGDLARPDLAIDAEDGARGLFHSLRRLVDLDDFVELRPGHIGGSLCGGAGMSLKPDSTIGYERRYNPYLGIMTEDEFVVTLTGEAGTPQPPNFEQIVEMNRGPLLTEAAVAEPLMPHFVRELIEDGAIVIDGRDQREFDATHVPGSINVTTSEAGVGTRAAWVAAPEDEVIVLATGDDQAKRMMRMLEAVGFRNLRGYLAGGMSAWNAEGLGFASIPALDVPGLAERIKHDGAAILDVRSEEEWKSGHVEGSIHVPYQELRNGIPSEVRNNGRTLIVACTAGVRSGLAASFLRRQGVDGIQHLASGGIEMLEDEGVPLVKEE